ncbi:MAG: hypothetical protein HQK51_11775 [Oligoflexia bacterium]|nr:hypothetical protein [Oligoflexia bacterium]
MTKYYVFLLGTISMLLLIYLTSVLASEEQQQHIQQKAKEEKIARSVVLEELAKVIHQTAGSAKGSSCDNLPMDYSIPFARIIAEYDGMGVRGETGKVMRSATGIEFPQVEINRSGPSAWKGRDAKGQDIYWLFDKMEDVIHQDDAVNYCDKFNKLYPALGCRFGLADKGTLEKLKKDMGGDVPGAEWNPPAESKLNEMWTHEVYGERARVLWSSTFSDEHNVYFLLGSTGSIETAPLTTTSLRGEVLKTIGTALCVCSSP